ncbi:hypothetical protein Q8F96_25855, partial [Klebsiella pneumoniae]|nr:hypothetical protein [Klebsiella pneumoniae]
YSLQAGLAVSSLIARNLPDTLSLALPAFLLAGGLAFPPPFASRLPGVRWVGHFFRAPPGLVFSCLFFTSPRPRDPTRSRIPSSSFK